MVGDIEEFLPVMAGMIGRVPLHLGLGRFVEPTTREVTIRIPSERVNPQP